MADTPTLVRFYPGSEHIGVGEDGMPIFAPTVRVQMDRPPYLSIDRVATEDDFHEHPGPYDLFRKTQAAIGIDFVEGYPLVLWPAINRAEIDMLAARDVVTVEQLAKLAVKSARNLAMPAELRVLADRAVELMKLQKGAGKYEELLRERDGRIAALQEQVDDLKQLAANLKAQNDTLKIARAA